VGGSRPRWRTPTADLVIICSAVLGAGLITADVLAGGLLTSLDEKVRDATFPSGGAPTWTKVVGLLGSVGVGSTAAVVAALVAMHLQRRWWPGFLVASQLAVVGIVVVGLKHLVARPGPAIPTLDDGYAGFFPSGHTATAMVSAGALTFVLSSRRGSMRRARVRGLLAGGGVGLLVASSTVLGGYHWLSDTLASLVIGTAVLVLGFSVVQTWAEPHCRWGAVRSDP